MEVFVDLEETLIQSWDNPLLCNLQKLRAWFKAAKVTDVHLFSFAVWNEGDRDHFIRHFQPSIEDAFEIKFKTVHTVEDFMKADTKRTGVRFDNLTEFILIRGKVGALQSWCGVNHPRGCSVLIDDVVPNMTIHDEDQDLLLKFINVIKMK